MHARFVTSEPDDHGVGGRVWFRGTRGATRAWSRGATAIALALATSTAPALANERALDATVFVRVVGDVTAVQGLDERFNREKIQISQVELGTGSGVVVSPAGYVLTNLHVIDSARQRLVYAGVPIEITLNVTRIEVQLPSRTGAQDRLRTFTASIVATDADLDLAVLLVSGADLPYLPLGDSDAIPTGKSVSAIGYPLGRDVDLASTDQGAAPAPTLTTGTLSAVRRDDRGSTRFLQTSAAVNPGNSGGALIDEDGYLVGIVELKMGDAKDIGFAIPINLAKEFLARHGVDGALPTPPLARNVRVELPAKGLRLLAPESFRDSAPAVIEVWSAQSIPGVTLRIGRLSSSITAAQLENALLGGQLVKSLSGRGLWSRGVPATGGAEARVGKAALSDGARLVYATVSRGKESVVAFYSGHADHIATNESLLLESLQSLEVNPLPASPP